MQDIEHLEDSAHPHSLLWADERASGRRRAGSARTRYKESRCVGAKKRKQEEKRHPQAKEEETRRKKQGSCRAEKTIATTTKENKGVCQAEKKIKKKRERQRTENKR